VLVNGGRNEDYPPTLAVEISEFVYRKMSLYNTTTKKVTRIEDAVLEIADMLEEAAEQLRANAANTSPVEFFKAVQ
jgi:hypothetical protein